MPPGRRLVESVRVELADDGPHAAIHVGAVVGVSDGGIQLRQVVAVLSDRVRIGSQPGDHALEGDDLRHAPHRSAGVLTGASHSAASSSSSLSSVIEQPAMSSEVM